MFAEGLRMIRAVQHHGRTMVSAVGADRFTFTLLVSSAASRAICAAMQPAMLHVNTSTATSMMHARDASASVAGLWQMQARMLDAKVQMHERHCRAFEQ